ncbi:BolA family protein [Thiosulfativibrio zosterae]|uniref:DNA-binding transcriptional regulator BolA n=1 Tax=Thiosulfativibrio zosterae TaxID=2675053 RepID=A0A6F8PQ39_9GAMM|nr:BolA family protein [Thiosulfativibrio zosterae]BBP44110.1 DNA-binding transcriptional regulator BolA [Thiosulfativibrio zosterae]
MSLQQQIETQITQNFPVAFMQLDNESHMHSGPATESHFKLTLVSEAFQGLSKVKRHQKVYQVLAEQMPQFHALALHTFSPEEWGAQVPVSTPCKGGH